MTVCPVEEDGDGLRAEAMALEVFAEPVVEKADVFGAFETDGADKAPVAMVDGEQVFGGWGLVGVEPLLPVFVVVVEVR